MFIFFTWSATYSEVRQASAMMLSVGFLSALLTNGAPSVANRFLQSQAWQKGFKTDILLLFPICVVPTSWIISPPREIPQLSSGPNVLRTSPPAVSMIIHEVGTTQM